ncbi:MOSC domain-containing protein [Paenibacillus sp. CAA11]|uniref:MOSC domain-containing protein n=1 Tax=Paenibacillus sp. CAA11 TaxID=1532905 RepID=UPI001F30670A|nr:MOSC domain-containing protein [Paenibacillus sp. CAA11]
MENGYTIRSLNVGLPKLLEGHTKPVQSGIGKQPVRGPIFLSELNLDGDGQGDLVHHGGPDKAVCVYAYDHMDYWSKTFNYPFEPGAFGENITLVGLVETEVCIGDIFHWGEAILQVTQPRQPCYKLAVRHGLPDLPKQVEKTGYTGFYFRVLKTGLVSSKDSLILQERHRKGITVAFAHRVMFGEKKDTPELRQLLEVDALSENWRKTLSKRTRI